MAEITENTETTVEKINPSSVLNALSLSPKLVGITSDKTKIYFYPLTVESFTYLDIIKSKLLYNTGSTSEKVEKVDEEFTNNLCTSLYIITHPVIEIKQQLLAFDEEFMATHETPPEATLPTLPEKLYYLSLVWAKTLTENIIQRLVKEFVGHFSIISSVGIHGTSSDIIDSRISNGFLTSLVYFAMAELHMDYYTALEIPLAVLILLRTENARIRDVKMMTLAEVEDM